MREPEIAAALEEMIPQQPELALTQGVGQRSLVFNLPPQELAWDVLDSHYGNVRRRPGFPDRETWYREYPEAGREIMARREGRRSAQLTLTEAAV